MQDRALKLLGERSFPSPLLVPRCRNPLRTRESAGLGCQGLAHAAGVTERMAR